VSLFYFLKVMED